ncbi:hypothetical protein L9F63_011999 [Diploptera punctata]|uniref:Large ribosomal subunit protein bL28m n=1 Tax=Diploptera punctata TaxID=6984 RepID=A0AAD8EP65_DIPPU|nr:hypothetical protein L9F63_011999 [Diploptera punctata]
MNKYTYAVKGHNNLLLRFEKPTRFSEGIASRLPEAYMKFWNEWKVQEPSPVHYIPEPGKWKRNPETGEVHPVQNTPIPLIYPKESYFGLWGGEGVIKGFQKRHRLRKRVPHYWFPTLYRNVIYSEILNKRMSTIVTHRTMQLIHKNYGLDHYILKTSACDLQSKLAMKLKRKMLLSLLKKDLYPDDEVKREEVYNTYKHYLENYSEEEIDWYGLTFFEAIDKQTRLEEAEKERNTVPLKTVYRSELIQKLQEAGIEAVNVALDEYEGKGSVRKSSWISKLNPFSSRKQDS